MAEHVSDYQRLEDRAWAEDFVDCAHSVHAICERIFWGLGPGAWDMT